MVCYRSRLKAKINRNFELPDLIPPRSGISPPPPLKLPSQKWRDLTLRVWQVDPPHRPPHLLGTSIHPSAFSLQPLAFILSAPPDREGLTAIGIGTQLMHD